MSTPFLISYGLLWTLVVAESALLFVLLREIGRVYLSSSSSLERDGLDIGAELPDVEVTIENTVQSLRSWISAAGETVVLFVSPRCPVCPRAIAALGQVLTPGNDVRALLLTEVEYLDYYAGSPTPIAGVDPEVARRELRLRATPYATVVGADGVVIGKGLVNYEEHLLRLLDGPDTDVIARNGRGRRPASANRRTEAGTGSRG